MTTTAENSTPDDGASPKHRLSSWLLADITEEPGGHLGPHRITPKKNIATRGGKSCV